MVGTVDGTRWIAIMPKIAFPLPIVWGFKPPWLGQDSTTALLLAGTVSNTREYTAWLRLKRPVGQQNQVPTSSGTSLCRPLSRFHLCNPHSW